MPIVLNARQVKLFPLFPIHKKKKPMLKILLRTILKSKLVSTISILGLTLGISVACIIFMFSKDELSYDKHIDNGRRIYRITHERKTSSGSDQTATTPIVLSTVLSGVTGIESKVRMLRESSVLIYNNTPFDEPLFCFTDPTIATVFDLKFTKGDPASAFSEKGIVMTERAAKRYFGNENPIGKSMIYRNWGTETAVEVTGVVEDIPEQSHFHFEVFGLFESPYNLWNDMHGTDWFHPGAWTYVLMREGMDEPTLAATINKTANTHLPEELKSATTFSLQALFDIHLQSRLNEEIEANGSLTMLQAFAAIGIAILLLACINYMNLATARGIERSKEIGIRKVMGAYQNDLMRLYLTETFLLVAIAAALCLLVIPLILPTFNLLIGKELRFNSLEWIWLLAAVTAVVGGVSGIYPAFYLSKQQPAFVLKMNKNFGGAQGGLLRKILVTTQFAATTVLLIAVFTISSQMSFMQNKDLGFSAREVLYLNGYNFRQAKNLKREVNQIPEVQSSTTCWAIPSSRVSFLNNLYKTNLTDENQRMEAFYASGDYDYENFFDLEVIEGRGFSDKFPEDTLRSVLVNETFAKQAGWRRDEAVGKQVEMFNMLGRSAGMRTVVGVLKDFHVQTLHESIKPLALGCSNRTGILAFRLNTNTPLETIEKVKKVAANFSGGEAINVRFLDEELNGHYQQEKRFNQTIKTFAVLAIVISCIGLFGLASFSAQRRAKEIAIRKVMGASVVGLMYKFTREFSSLVLISFFVGAPLSYFLLSRWLEAFPYRIDQSPAFYIAPLAFSLVLSAITVGFHSVTSARANPVATLKED